MNSVTLIGALTRDPEMNEGGDTKICSLRVADGNGRKEPLFINVSAFGRQAETCKEYLTKGRQVAVSGQLRFREWERIKASGQNTRSQPTASISCLAPKRCASRKTATEAGILKIPRLWQ